MYVLTYGQYKEVVGASDIGGPYCFEGVSVIMDVSYPHHPVVFSHGDPESVRLKYEVAMTIANSLSGIWALSHIPHLNRDEVVELNTALSQTGYVPKFRPR